MQSPCTRQKYMDMGMWHVHVRVHAVEVAQIVCEESGWCCCTGALPGIPAVADGRPGGRAADGGVDRDDGQPTSPRDTAEITSRKRRFDWSMLRRSAEISPGSLRASLLWQVGNFSEGNSGGFFFHSTDRRYLIKTLTRPEQRRLIAMLPRYYEYLRKSPRTLLCRFFGCYSITMHGQSVWFVTMEVSRPRRTCANARQHIHTARTRAAARVECAHVRPSAGVPPLPTSQNTPWLLLVSAQSLFHTALPVHEKYDLKGSWVDRSIGRSHSSARSASWKSRSTLPRSTTAQAAFDCADALERGATGEEDEAAADAADATDAAETTPAIPPTRKDNDLTRKLKLPPRAREALHVQCAADAELLRSLNVMDYSLLMGVHYPAAAAGAGAATGSATATTAGGAVTDEQGPLVFHAAPADGAAVYYVAIVDLLQTWTLAKRIERWVKLTLCCRCGASAAGMSAVEPSHYARRFVRMIERILDIEPACKQE